MRRIGPYDTHEAPPERIKTVKVAQTHLCSLAYHRKKVYPEQCKACGGCKYGLRLLELLGMECDEQPKLLTVKQLTAPGQPLPTLHMRLKKRKK